MAIQPNGDTIVVVPQPDYKYFKIKDAIYCPLRKDKCVEIIASSEIAQLAKYEKFVIKRRDKISNDNYATYVDQTNSVRSLVNMGYGRMIYYQDLLYTKNVSFYLITSDGTHYHASKSKFLSVFSKHKSAVGRYLEKNPVDFKSETDLTRLFEYCAGFESPTK
jgi:hypothetical protein